jgi:hypothetical protein
LKYVDDTAFFPYFVMAWLVPAIHDFDDLGAQDVDARHIGERSDAVL